jgi:hypothetical protein
MSTKLEESGRILKRLVEAILLPVSRVIGELNRSLNIWFLLVFIFVVMFTI